MNSPTADRPPFSIVIVNYNYAAFLPQAVDSALAQTLPGCEVIVVDDRSTDDSRDVMRSYGERIVALYRPENGGMSAAVNTGFTRSSGRVVLFLDADDYLYPHAAERMAAAAVDGVAQVQARLHLVDVAGRIEDVFPALEVGFDRGDVTAALRARGRYSTTVTSGLAFSRAALERIMPIPERAFDRSADGYLAAVAPLHGRVAGIEEPVGAYRRHDANHSGFGANMAKRARWRVDHDEHRYSAMREHGDMGAGWSPGLSDATHVEQRLASLCFDRAQHPYARDRRGALGLAGARAAFAGTTSLKRRATNAGLFLLAGFAPAPVARRSLAWKLERSSRPRVVDWLAGRLRRLMG
ncbi:glycosyltransferase family 2 protein [uncultured Sphingomonas sp.]|uniref:glycosyltransferase family 2 protein n=1 Tax=uncultured Sphingomonas sp. TaxID=158754 RepID=UPI0035C9C9D9